MDELERKALLLDMISVTIRDAIQNGEAVTATQEFYSMVKFFCRHTIPDVKSSEIAEMMTRPLIGSFRQKR
jgi:hypothetical protein